MLVDELIGYLRKLPEDMQVKINIAAFPELVFRIDEGIVEDAECFDGKYRPTLILKNKTPGAVLSTKNNDN